MAAGYCEAMPTCFVAQPFREPYQARFIEDLKPAIEAAGLTAYKVDLDPAADRLIEDIEANIRVAEVVLVDITEDNPNVWYELGFSQALAKPVVLISCSTDRGDRPYPFDVRGRKIIGYATGTRSAHDKLRADITERIAAILRKGASNERATHGQVPAPAYTVADIKLKLRDWMRKRPYREGEDAIEFAALDAALGLPAGSAREHLVEVAKDLGFTVAARGDATVAFRRPAERRRKSLREELDESF